MSASLVRIRTYQASQLTCPPYNACEYRVSGRSVVLPDDIRQERSNDLNKHWKQLTERSLTRNRIFAPGTHPYIQNSSVLMIEVDLWRKKNNMMRRHLLWLKTHKAREGQWGSSVIRSRNKHVNWLNSYKILFIDSWRPVGVTSLGATNVALIYPERVKVWATDVMLKALEWYCERQICFRRLPETSSSPQAEVTFHQYYKSASMSRSHQRSPSPDWFYKKTFTSTVWVACEVSPRFRFPCQGHLDNVFMMQGRVWRSHDMLKAQRKKSQGREVRCALSPSNSRPSKSQGRQDSVAHRERMSGCNPPCQPK